MVMSSKHTAAAAAIRTALKAAGFSRNDVAVKVGIGGMVHVTVKRADIALETVRQVARPFESVMTAQDGDAVLGVGNVYISVARPYVGR